MAQSQLPKVAQIGCGHWGKNLTRTFAQLGALAALHDPMPETSQKFADEYGVSAKSFEDILADDAIDAVSLASPAELHAEQAIAALNADKYVYVEKPIALTVADAEKIVALAESKGKTLMVGHLLQYHPIFVELRKRVEAGELGDIRYVYSNRMSLGKFRVEENSMWSFMPHDLSMLLSLVGKTPKSVSASGGAYVTDGIEDLVRVDMQFDNGVHAHAHANWLHPFKEQRLVVVGDKSMAVFEDSQPEWGRKLAFYDHQIDTSGHAPQPTKADARYIEVEKGEPLKAECQHFLDCIVTGTKPRTDGREALEVLSVLERATTALKAGA